MKKELIEYSPLDNRPRDEMSHEDIMKAIDEATTCVFIRLRGDGHPIGGVVGGAVVDGEIYTLTNVFRAAYGNIRRDPRCCVVFDAQWAGVTVVGRAEIIEDREMLQRFFNRLGRFEKPQDEVGAGVGNNWANTPNRRLFHIIPEKFITSDQRWLMDEAKIALWRENGNKWPEMTAAGNTDAAWWPGRPRGKDTRRPAKTT